MEYLCVLCGVYMGCSDVIISTISMVIAVRLHVVCIENIVITWWGLYN